MSCLLATGATLEEQPYTYSVSRLNGATPILINEHGHPLVAMNQVGRGRVIVGAVDHWMTDRVTYRVPEIVNMEPPYLLLRGIRVVPRKILRFVQSHGVPARGAGRYHVLLRR